MPHSHDLTKLQLQPVLELRNTPTVDAFSAASRQRFSGKGFIFGAIVTRDGTLLGQRSCYVRLSIDGNQGLAMPLVEGYLSPNGRRPAWTGLLPVDDSFEAILTSQITNDVSAITAIAKIVWASTIV